MLAGLPNAGKSSLINALTGRDRAVVSDIAGTTRDVLTAPLDLPRGRVVLADVAGIEAASLEALTIQQQIDQQMQIRAQSAMESADHLVLVRDATDTRPSVLLPRMPDLVVLTKSDLVKEAIQQQGILVSSRTYDGMAELRESLDRLAFGSITTISTLALNRRHLGCITDVRAALARAAEKVHEDAAELVAAELREALDHLGSILGNVTPDDVLGRVFSAFCIGK